MIIGAMAPGSVARLAVLRDNKRISIDVKVSESSDSASVKGKKATSEASRLGVTVRSLNAEEKQAAGAEGLLVVKSTGAAKKAGIAEGDIIVNINGAAIKKPADLSKAVSGSKMLRVLVQRRDARIFIPVKIK